MVKKKRRIIKTWEASLMLLIATCLWSTFGLWVRAFIRMLYNADSSLTRQPQQELIDAISKLISAPMALCIGAWITTLFFIIVIVNMINSMGREE